jgi:carboxyl-terminal processing protease
MYEINGEKFLSLRSGIVAGIAIALLGFAGGTLVSGHTVLGQESVDFAQTGMPSDVDFTPVWRAWSIINEKFVPAAVATSTPMATSTAKLNQQKVYGMIEGLAASLNDPYTYFLPPVENQQFASDMKGSFEGVGMQIDVKDHILTVISPLKGTPSEKAGIKAGDLILKIDGVSTAGLDVSQAVDKIRGPRGSQVTLTIMREGWKAPQEIKVTRETISVPVVITKQLPNGVFQIQLTTFTANSGELFRNALREFVISGNNKLILDLRGNPGGYLESAVEVASWFLPSGDTVVTEDYAGHASNIVHRSYGYNIFGKNMKMVIIVDKGSASASEILADALQHYGVAKLVGVNTFGKGSVQELIDITPDTSLKVTVARWLGPDGTQIPREGITPDVNVGVSDADLKAEKDPQLDKAIELLNQ